MSTIVPFRIPRPNARIRLFCLPFAGAGANVYRAWTQRFAATIDVCPVELPGHGVRNRERLVPDMATLTTTLLADLAPLLDLPIAFFGHSMGAKLAFELAKQLGARVAHLFVSAATAPDIAALDPIAHLPYDGFLDGLRRMGGTPEELLGDPEIMELVAPTLRNDLALHESYRVLDGVRAPCGITTFAATADPRVPLDTARRWESFSGGSFRFLTLDAGHFFLAEATPMLVGEIASDLARVSGGPLSA